MARLSLSTFVDRLSTKCKHLVENMQPGTRTRIRSHTSGLRCVIFDAHVAKNDEIVIRCLLTLTAHAEVPASYAMRFHFFYKLGRVTGKTDGAAFDFLLVRKMQMGYTIPVKELICMSTREQCMELLDSVPEFKLGYVLAYLQGLTADEAADDDFCEMLYQNYLDDPDQTKNESISLENLAAELGVSL